MAKHTKGPWHRNIKPARKYAVIFAGRNTHVCVLRVDGLTDEEIEANCDLIAAAPDLLAALKTIVTPPTEYAATQAYRDRVAEARTAALAAIAKAEGRGEAMK